MFQKTATINDSGSSQKCPQCGLRNFANAKDCKRCKSGRSVLLPEANADKRLIHTSSESGQSTFKKGWLLAVVVVVLAGVVLFYLRSGPQGTSPGTLSTAELAPPAAVDGEEPVQDPAEENARNQAVATHVLVQLERFQEATESGMPYQEYDKKLTDLKADLEKALPAFVRHEPADETLREEISGAIRDYTAAGNWWKTTIVNSSVYSEADRSERTQLSWASAREHLTNAQKLLPR